MNINILRKKYGKLTVKERFSAVVAAGMRGDTQAQDALMQSAPKVTINVKHHYGLAIAFDRLGMFHQMRQLANASNLVMAILIDGRTQDPDGLFKDIGILTERYKTGAAAWAALCKEYGLDPQAPLESLPGIEVLEKVNRIVELNQDETGLPQLSNYLEDLRLALDSMANQWV